jgi:hypothetical protein
MRELGHVIYHGYFTLRMNADREKELMMEVKFRAKRRPGPVLDLQVIKIYIMAILFYWVFGMISN